MSIGGTVPGVTPTEKFNKFGEGLSYDGRYVSFWGAWGDESQEIKKYCPKDGNKDLLDYCNNVNGINTSDPPDGTDAGGAYYLLSVPKNQGIFVADTSSNTVSLVQRTEPTNSSAAAFKNFIYWTYSGKPPGGEEAEDAEPPRWRASAFTAVKSDAVAFKGLKGGYDVSLGAVDGLYVKRFSSSSLITALDTTMTGQSVDPNAPAGSLVSAIGVERDGFRGSWLSITASMLNATTTASWAGVYVHNCGSGCGTW